MRPYVLLSCAVSVDGCLDTAGPGRLLLSGSADLDSVDGERAAADAVMVGAATLRQDDPRLTVRSPERQVARLARGLPPHPHRVTVTASGALRPAARFFQGPAQVRRLVFCPAPMAADLHSLLNDSADVIGLPPPVSLAAVLDELRRQGVARLMVEGGARLGQELLSGGLVDELRLAVAPFFVGETGAPRFAAPASYPHGPSRPMTLAGVARLDGLVVLRYLLRDAGEGAGEATAPDG